MRLRCYEEDKSLLYRGNSVALIVPCYNEALTIKRVIDEFGAAMPALQIYVFDNCSTDGTAECARLAGATVDRVSARGKGNVVRRMFADVEADIYVMVDGDATYDAGSVRILVDRLIDDRLDMVVGRRVTSSTVAAQAYRSGHQWGNRLLTGCVSLIFGRSFSDMLSGYRVFSRRYVKSFPALSRAFEIETELTVHALELRMPCEEVATPYGARPEGSVSKLATYRDGMRILSTIGRLFVSERPLAFFGICSAVLSVASLAFFAPVLIEYMATGLVPRLPTLILSGTLMIAALLALSTGLALDNVVRGRMEMKRLAYLGTPAPSRA